MTETCWQTIFVHLQPQLMVAERWISWSFCLFLFGLILHHRAGFFLVLVLLSVSVERFFVSHMRDFYFKTFKPCNILRRILVQRIQSKKSWLYSIFGGKLERKNWQEGSILPFQASKEWLVLRGGMGLLCLWPVSFTTQIPSCLR